MTSVSTFSSLDERYCAKSNNFFGEMVFFLKLLLYNFLPEYSYDVITQCWLLSQVPLKYFFFPFRNKLMAQKGAEETNKKDGYITEML